MKVISESSNKMFFEFQKSKYRGKEYYKKKKWLRYQYITLKHTMEQIAEISGVSIHVIKYQLNKFNLLIKPKRIERDEIYINNDFYIEKHEQISSPIIYFLQEMGSKAIKIGYTINLRRRLKVIQPYNPNRLRVLCIMEGDLEEEAELHNKYSEYNIHGEWFYPAPELLDFIDKLKILTKEFI